MSTQALKWVFEALDIKGLGPTERAVLHYLSWRHNHKTGECFPAMLTIAKHADVSERRASTAIQNLKKAGLIQSARRCGQAGNSSNQYTLLPFAKTFQTGTKKQGETGTRVPIPDQQTVADDKGSYLTGKKEGSLAKKKSGRGNA